MNYTLIVFYFVNSNNWIHAKSIVGFVGQELLI